jgi:hypothetical protein
MSIKTHERGSRKFVALVELFLVITHQALLDCFAVDIAVGNLYNYISGSDGKRAISFLQRVCTNLLDYQREKVVLVQQRC